MEKVKVEIQMTSLDGQREPVQGFKYLWCKKVDGFDPAVHCARCLIGHYHKPFGTKMLANLPIEADFYPGDILYFCGVSVPYRHHHSLHLACRVDPDYVSEIDLYTGGKLIVEGVRNIAFDDTVAREKFPHLGKEFLTCRNFQFAAQFFKNVKA